MTPYEIDVLLHYYCRAVDHPDMERNPPVWKPTILQFVGEGLLAVATSKGMCYSLTERGQAYVDALQRVPLPRSAWIVDWPLLPPRDTSKVIEVERIAVSDDQSQAIPEARHQGKDS